MSGVGFSLVLHLSKDDKIRRVLWIIRRQVISCPTFGRGDFRLVTFCLGMKCFLHPGSMFHPNSCGTSKAVARPAPTNQEAGAFKAEQQHDSCMPAGLAQTREEPCDSWQLAGSPGGVEG